MGIIVVVLIGLVLIALLLFPFVGLAMIPVAAAAVFIGFAWLFITFTRGPKGLPEHPLPGEDRGAPSGGASGPR